MSMVSVHLETYARLLMDTWSALGLETWSASMVSRCTDSLQVSILTICANSDRLGCDLRRFWSAPVCRYLTIRNVGAKRSSVGDLETWRPGARHLDTPRKVSTAPHLPHLPHLET